VAAALPGIDSGRVESIEHLKHGLTNESWLVRTERDALVIRRSNPEEASLQINRESEAAILAAVASAGIGPEVVRCDPTQHILVTRYAGATWSESDAIRPDNIERIAGLIRRLHALQPPAGAQQVDLATAVDGYLDTLDAHGVHCAIAVPALRRRAR
jgi:thiamine kinase-like enzyme